MVRHALRDHVSEFITRSALWGVAFALALAIPADLVDTPFFSRMTSATWIDYSLWIAIATLGGLVMGARRLPGASACDVGKPAIGGEGLGFLAVACPVCNKLIVMSIGTSGALSYFAPIQPLLGLAGLIVLAWVLRRSLVLAARGSTRLTPTIASI